MFSNSEVLSISSYGEFTVKTPEIELKAYLGLIDYSNKFIPNMSTKSRCLYNFLKMGVKFTWSKSCEESFQQNKQKFSANILDVYDPTKLLVVITDTYGSGGVYSHITDELKNQSA